jgi:hypothetical protein
VIGEVRSLLLNAMKAGIRAADYNYAVAAPLEATPGGAP